MRPGRSVHCDRGVGDAVAAVEPRRAAAEVRVERGHGNGRAEGRSLVDRFADLHLVHVRQADGVPGDVDLAARPHRGAGALHVSGFEAGGEALGTVPGRAADRGALEDDRVRGAVEDGVGEVEPAAERVRRDPGLVEQDRGVAARAHQRGRAPLQGAGVEACLHQRDAVLRGVVVHHGAEPEVAGLLVDRDEWVAGPAPTRRHRWGAAIREGGSSVHRVAVALRARGRRGRESQAVVPDDQDVRALRGDHLLGLSDDCEAGVLRAVVDEHVGGQHRRDSRGGDHPRRRRECAHALGPARLVPVAPPPDSGARTRPLGVLADQPGERLRTRHLRARALEQEGPLQALERGRIRGDPRPGRRPGGMAGGLGAGRGPSADRGRDRGSHERQREHERCAEDGGLVDAQGHAGHPSQGIVFGPRARGCHGRSGLGPSAPRPGGTSALMLLTLGNPRTPGSGSPSGAPGDRPPETAEGRGPPERRAGADPGRSQGPCGGIPSSRACRRPSGSRGSSARQRRTPLRADARSPRSVASRVATDQ